MKQKIIDLGMHPYADTFISKDQLHLSEPVFPLECYLNKKNFEIKLGVETNPDDRYNLYDYSYTSSNSSFSRKYWSSYCKDIINLRLINYESSILEIGSNDGYLLSLFKKEGFKNVTGYDSSKKMVDVAKKSNIKTIHGLFNSKNAAKLKLKYDMIIANNVFNHSDNPKDFLNGISSCLNTNGIFVFEVPYWLDTIKDYRFDQIYHEHVSYFTVKSAKYMLESNGLKIFKVQKSEYHGGSIRIYCSLNNRSINDYEKFIIDRKSVV